MQRQKIRPSFSELQHPNDDDEYYQDEESESDDGVPEYPPAATPIRGLPPPVIASSSGRSGSSRRQEVKKDVVVDGNTSALKRPTTTQSKSVRIAPSSTTQVREIEGRTNQHKSTSRFVEAKARKTREPQGPESFRFTLDEDDFDQKDNEASGSTPRQGPLIGSIQERIGLNSGITSKATGRTGLSKFAQSKKVEANDKVKIDISDKEEWLDEDGQPMSAFRKSRLLKQGKGPPIMATKRGSETMPPRETVSVSSPLERKGQSPLESLMKSISMENEARLSAMSVEEMEQDLQDLSSTFGADVLEKLKKRREGKQKEIKGEEGQSEPLNIPTQQERVKKEEVTSEQIRSKYFPTESEKLPPSLQWTTQLNQEDSNNKDALRFDFTGALVREGVLSDEETHLAGLHHHGSEQHRAGYTLAELLHLARSTLPSQRIIALQTLERVFIRYMIQTGQKGKSTESGARSKEAQVAQYLEDDKTRTKAAVIASWYIDDRQVSVRSAALRCFDACQLEDIIAALLTLPRGQEKAALFMINTILPTKTEAVSRSDLFNLQPFFNELLRSISSQEGDDDIDPLSGIELWKSASSGLPLRVDWPLIALDDLLHSGNCASLNRKNVLSSSWDANERQIVVSSLRLGSQLWKEIMKQSPANVTIIPSASEIYLAIVKVFMLEEEQSQDGKATGLITGRDLFRDDQIASLLTDSFALAKSIDGVSRTGKDDMEKVAQRQFDNSLPFYQLYTSLIGLYDSISFGWELFGRILLVPQASEYASDYRRLLWIDYSHCLPSIQTQVSQSPFDSLQRFLYSEEKDDGILQAMATALMSGRITRERNELLYHIAVQQIANELWNTTSARREVLARSIFHEEGSFADVQAAIEFYGLDGNLDGQQETQKRKEWLQEIRH